MGTFTPAVFLNYTDFQSDAGDTSGATGNNGTAYAGTYSRRYAAIGQGFMLRNNPNIIGNDTDGVQNADAEFDNSMRVYIKKSLGNVDIFAKNSNPSLDYEIAEEIVGMSHNGLDYMNILNKSYNNSRD